MPLPDGAVSKRCRTAASRRAGASAAALADVVFVNSIAIERTHRCKLGNIASTGLDAARLATLIHSSGAALRPGTREEALISMGAVVPGDMPAGVVIVGNPGRPLAG